MRQVGATLHRGARASHYRGLSCCGAQAPDAQAQHLWLTGLVASRHVGSSQTRARTRVPCIGRQILNHCTTREAPGLVFKKTLSAMRLSKKGGCFRHDLPLGGGCLLLGSLLDSVSLLGKGSAGAWKPWLMAVRSTCLGRRPDEGPRAVLCAPSPRSSSVCGEEEGETVATQTFRQIKPCFEEVAAIAIMCLEMLWTKEENGQRR